MAFSLFKKLPNDLLRARAEPPRPAEPAVRPAEGPAPRPEPPAAEAPAAEHSFPEPVGGIGNIDLFQDLRDGLAREEQGGLARVAERVEEGKFELPHLPSTQMMLLELTSNPDADIGKVERQVSADLALTATILRAANSVLFGGTRKVEDVRGAILRLGLRGLRSALYTCSLKSVIFRAKGLDQYAEEIWRQARSVAGAARALAVPLCLDPERVFVLGLLHDVGKVPLLSILRKEAPPSFAFRKPFVGVALGTFHERVGRRLTASWNLPEEVVEVSGCHHDFGANAGFLKSAALVNLAHRQDLYLSCGEEEKYESLLEYPALAALELAEGYRKPLLEAVKAGYLKGNLGAIFG
ncbi:MAG: HDOD domain-containing protein [Planctomycetes bacterium]|nr:HDOD domain-containing protein [Planctomycetota bacterium]